MEGGGGAGGQGPRKGHCSHEGAESEVPRMEILKQQQQRRRKESKARKKDRACVLAMGMAAQAAALAPTSGATSDRPVTSVPTPRAPKLVAAGRWALVD